MDLKNRLQQVLLSEDLSKQQQLINELSQQLNVNITDCAAALVHLLQSKTDTNSALIYKNNAAQTSVITPPVKMLRYHLDVGRKHQISVEILKQLLVEESGVDYKLIGYIDLYHDYCLIKLPNKMPADIFQHLQSVEINQQKLNIKRYNRQINNKKQRNHHTRQQSSAS